MTAARPVGMTRWPLDRYRALRSDPDARLLLRGRAAITAALRERLDNAGFLEIDTPLLQPADHSSQRPFAVAAQFLEDPVALRGSPLYLRGMLAAGFEQVYEVARSFRDEPSDITHLPEYTLLEIFQAHADYIDMRNLVRVLVREAARAVRIRTGNAVRISDLPWPTVDIYDAVGRAIGHRVTPTTSAEELQRLGADNNAPTDPDSSVDAAVLTLYDRLVEPATQRPTFYTGFPTSCSPLAEREPTDEHRAKKWDLVIGGREIATAYTELSDPTELRRRLRQHSAEAATIDERMLAVFDLGIPPAAGLCIGLDRLVLTLTGAACIHDIVPVPLTPAHPVPPRLNR